ncbi:MAG: hypothetical protein E6K76_06050 [Candidatus Eisenbacteria bacterium]|uniref:DUF4156 domain-containing protein n=1 Tax=Eiseniibacteriota bacterium TaxID=2212470 RepID=A0A538T5X1_UNCEI|nr:MAG: hypothetical protein E6K76_06050 [Candidatus Eisenbacteria bacterium]
MRTAVAIPFLLMIAACAHVDYIGRSYAPTNHVDLFFAEKDVTHEYEVMGKVVATANDLVSAEKLQAKVLEKAQSKGADAVVLLGLDRYKSGENTNYRETTEDKGRKTTTTGHSNTSSEEKKEVQALFLKYR